MNKDQALRAWSRYLIGAARQGQITPDPCTGITEVVAIPGPRAGALEILAGLHAGPLLRALRRDECAALRQFIPWDFKGDPQVFMNGRYLRVEAGWSDDLATSMVKLSDLNIHPHSGGRWATGQSETGHTIIATLDDRTAHFLVSGTTGSGKSVALQSATIQLARDPKNTIMLIDGKHGESLKQLENLPGVVGPCAVERVDIRNALGYAIKVMRNRYEIGNTTKARRLIVVFDEIQEMVQDDVIAELMRKLTSQGRGAEVHCILATQHPTVGTFGDTSTRRMLEGMIALRVADADASRVAVGGNFPRADHLLGAGDAYTIAPGACHRVQLVYVDNRDVETVIESRGPADWQFNEWPDFVPEDIGQDAPDATGWSYNGKELAVSLIAAMEGRGRPTVKNMVEDVTGSRPGSVRAKRLMDLGREALRQLELEGYDLARKEGGLT